VEVEFNFLFERLDGDDMKLSAYLTQKRLDTMPAGGIMLITKNTPKDLVDRFRAYMPLIEWE